MLGLTRPLQVALGFPVVLESLPIVGHSLTICYTATDSLAPGESPDDYYPGLAAMKRTLQETNAKVRPTVICIPFKILTSFSTAQGGG